MMGIWFFCLFAIVKFNAVLCVGTLGKAVSEREDQRQRESAVWQWQRWQYGCYIRQNGRSACFRSVYGSLCRCCFLLPVVQANRGMSEKTYQAEI